MTSLARKAALLGAVALASLPAVAFAASPTSPTTHPFAAAVPQVPLGPSVFNGVRRFAPEPSSGVAAADVVSAPQPELRAAVQPDARPVVREAQQQPAAVQAAPAKPEFALPATDGFDISWPQCNDPAPTSTAFNFAIIGVTGGKALTTNNCLRKQWDWASTGNVQPQAYINVNGMPEGWRDWACPPDAENCYAYAYGHWTAESALKYANDNGIDSKVWWLDVEEMNYWRPDLLNNAFVIRGAVEFLQQHGKTVGLYSTPYQWGEIAGGYAPHLDVWTAGADDRADAISRCSGDKYAFNGGKVKLVQYIWANYDTNYAC